MMVTHGDLFSLNIRSIDSLKVSISKYGQDTNRVKTWIVIASEYRRENSELCKSYCDSVLMLSEKLNYANGKGYAFYYKGISSFYAEKRSEAIEFYKRARIFFSGAHNQSKEADCLLKIGSVNLVMGNNVDAANYLIESSKIYNKIGDTINLGKCYNNISIAYANSGNNDLAEKYLLKALEIDLAGGNKEDIFGTYLNLANLLDTKCNYEKAQFYYEKCLNIGKELNDNGMIGKAYGGLSVIMSSLGEHQNAMNFAKKAIALADTAGDKDELSTLYCALANACIHLNDLSGALEATNKANSFLSEESYLYGGKTIMEYYSLIYERKGDLKKALEYQKALMAIKDSLYNIENAEKIAGLNIRYETEIREQKLKLNEIELDKQNKINEQKNVQLWIAGVSFFVVLILGIFVFINYRLAKEQKSIIEQKNKENELLLSEIHHRVKNNLQVISSLLSLQERSMESGSAKSAIHEGKERVKSMELVHKMLYQGNSFSGIEMKDYVDKLSLGLIESFGLDKKNVEIITGFKAITLDVDAAIPLGLILNELIVNSLKHAVSTTEKLILKIEIHEDEAKKLQLSIADNGKGKVSDIENSNSFGLKIIRALVRQLDGIMDIKEENGIRFSIAFKNYKLIA